MHPATRHTTNTLTKLSGHRFGFNNQEKDNEVAGNGNSYTAEYWQYDARLGRRWNTDPVIYPWQSPYSAFNNNPIYFIDPDGREGIGAWFKKAAHNVKEFVKHPFDKAARAKYLNSGPSGGGKAGSVGKGGITYGHDDLGNITASISEITIKPPGAWDRFKDWWRNSELFFSARGKIDVGAQAGGHIQILNQKLALEGNLVSFDVIGAGVEQRGNSNNPHEWSFDYLGEDGYLKVNQGAEGSVPIFGGAKYEHNFEGRLAGGYRNETHTTTITATAIQYQNKQIVKSAMSVNELKFSVGARIALIGGAEINVEFGVKDKE